MTAPVGPATATDSSDPLDSVGPGKRSEPDRQRQATTPLYDSAIKRGWRRTRRPALGVMGVVGILVAWHATGAVGWIDRRFFSSPTAVWQDLWVYLGSDAGRDDLRVSLREFAYGFGLSLVGGVLIGIIAGWNRTIDALIDPIISFIYNAPRIALAPLFIVWFGIGELSKVTMVIFSAIFPIMFGARAGVANTDPALVAMARSYGASGIELVRSVVAPAALPAISSGVRVGIHMGLSGMVFAEYIASVRGLGNALKGANALFAMDRLFSVVMIIAVLGLLLTVLFKWIETYFDRWRPPA